MDDIQRTLTAAVVRGATSQDSEEIVGVWLEENGGGIARVRKVLDAMRTSATYDFATLSVAIQEIRKLGIVSSKGQSIGT